MPESPVFGRRKTAAAGATPAPVPGDETGRHLGHFAERMLIGGGLVEFCGLLVLFVATQVWPSDPASLGELDRTVYVPAVLKDSLAAMQPTFAVHTVRTVVQTVGIDLTNPAAILLAVTGLGAALRGRWWLAAPAAAFFAFPWGLIGYHVVGAPVVLAFFAGASLYGLYRPRLWIAIGVGLVAVFLVQAVSPLSEMIGRLTFADTVKMSYLTIALDDLKKADKSAGSVLAGLPVAGQVQSAAKSYVVGQELALRGDATDVLTAVQDAVAKGFAATIFDQRRTDAIRRYATVSGVLGEAARNTEVEKDRVRRMIALALVGVAVPLALFGPIGNILGQRLLKRVSRLGRARSEIETRYKAIVRSEAEVAGRDMSTIRSMAVLDGQAAVAAIAGRVHFYRYAVAALAVMVVGFLAGAWWLWLPGSGDNTAFTMVSLPPQLAQTAHDAGLAVSGGRFDVVPFCASVLSALAPLVGIYLLLRRRRLAPVAILFLAYSFIEIAGLAPIRHAFTEVAPAAMGEEMIATWRAGADNPDTVDAPDALHGSEAAYGLAQLAYMAGRPAETQSYLEKIRDTKVLGGAVHRQKIDLMRAWGAAHGYPIAAASAAAKLPATMAVIRALSRLSLGLGFVLAALALLAAAANLIAERTCRRIEGLIAARSALDAGFARRKHTMPSTAG